MTDNQGSRQPRSLLRLRLLEGPRGDSRDGVLGRVVQAQIEYVRRYDKDGPWRNPENTDATPRRVVGMGGIWQWPDGRDLPDNVEKICEYPRGMTVDVLGTMSNREGIDHLIRGDRGTMEFTPTTASRSTARWTLASPAWWR